MKKSLASLLIIVSFLGCTSLPSLPLSRYQTAENLANRNQLSKALVESGKFTLTTYRKIKDTSKPINVYIEGDGLAWVNRSTPSTDPTPIHPISLELASLDNHPNVLYIARPCQYTPFKQSPKCHRSYWTNKRFAQEVVESINGVIDIYTQHYHIQSVQLIGYSGGGAIAFLIAAQRNDIQGMITLAGNLDIEAWTSYHSISPLTGSLNPIDFIDQNRNVPQVHFFAKDDQIIPLSVLEEFQGTNNHSLARYIILEDVTHRKGWEENWPIIREALL